MLQKYINDDAMFLIASDISFDKQNSYTYEWYDGSTFIGSSYQQFYTFTSYGIHNIKLTYTNVDNGLSTTITQQINVIAKSGSVKNTPSVMTVNVLPTNKEIYLGDSQQFNAYINGSSTPSSLVTWNIDHGDQGNTHYGIVNSNGLYTTYYDMTTTNEVTNGYGDYIFEVVAVPNNNTQYNGSAIVNNLLGYLVIEDKFDALFSKYIYHLTSNFKINIWDGQINVDNFWCNAPQVEGATYADYELHLHVNYLFLTVYEQSTTNQIIIYYKSTTASSDAPWQTLTLPDTIVAGIYNNIQIVINHGQSIESDTYQQLTDLDFITLLCVDTTLTNAVSYTAKLSNFTWTALAAIFTASTPGTARIQNESTITSKPYYWHHIRILNASSVPLSCYEMDKVAFTWSLDTTISFPSDSFLNYPFGIIYVNPFSGGQICIFWEYSSSEELLALYILKYELDISTNVIYNYSINNLYPYLIMMGEGSPPIISSTPVVQGSHWISNSSGNYNNNDILGFLNTGNVFGSSYIDIPVSYGLQLGYIFLQMTYDVDYSNTNVGDYITLTFLLVDCGNGISGVATGFNADYLQNLNFNLTSSQFQYISNDNTSVTLQRINDASEDWTDNFSLELSGAIYCPVLDNYNCSYPNFDINIQMYQLNQSTNIIPQAIWDGSTNFDYGSFEHYTYFKYSYYENMMTSMFPYVTNVRSLPENYYTTKNYASSKRYSKKLYDEYIVDYVALMDD
jgi:hypothetical protein